jgi:hypothetical protein
MINSEPMSKYLGIVIGVIAVIAGVAGAVSWQSDILTMIRGSMPVIFVLGGVIAVIAGLSEIKDEISSKKESIK